MQQSGFNAANRWVSRSFKSRTSMVWKSIFVGMVVWILSMVPVGCSLGFQQHYDNGISDEEYVSIASKHQDAKFFLTSYPESETYIDRSGKLAVDFRVDTKPIRSTTDKWKGIRLRVFIDPETRRATDTLIQCNDMLIEEEIRQYLEYYFANGTCH